MMKGYQALEALGGEHTHIMLGDWSHVPNFLFPPMSASKAVSPEADAGKRQP